MKNPTLAQFAEDYILTRDLSATTEQQMRCTVAHFERLMGRSFLLAEVTDEHVNKYLKTLKELGRARETIRSRRTNILSLLNEAYRQRLSEFDNRRVMKPAPHRQVIDSWGLAEVQKLFDAAATLIGMPKMRGGIDEGYYWQAYIPAAWDSGLRHGDLVKLPRKDIKTRFWWTQKKTGNPVLVELRPETIELIDRLADSRQDDSFPLAFPYRREIFFKRARELADLAGVQGTFKFIRRGCATAIATDTQRIADASRKLGHTNEAITKKHYLSPSWQEYPETLPPPILTKRKEGDQ